MRNRIFQGDFPALEEMLWREVAAAQKDDPLTPVTIVAPTGHLVRRLKHEAARHFPRGLLNVRFANLFQYALGIAERRPDAPRYFSEPLLAERILLRALSRGPVGEGATYDRAGTMRSSLRDLKDAAVPADLPKLLERVHAAIEEKERGEISKLFTRLDLERLTSVMEVYREYEKELERLGIADLPDIFRLAKEAGSESESGEGEDLFVYGFYDVTQVQADFLVALRERMKLSLFIPQGTEGCWTFSSWYRDTLAPILGEYVERREPGPLLTREVRNASGERDEVLGCAREIRTLLDDGVPAAEIALTARVLDPYVDAIDEVFREQCIPSTTLPGRPLQEHPLAKVVLLHFRASLEEFPRSSVLGVLLHPLYRAEGERVHWDYLARALHIGHGEDWDRLERFREEGYTVHSGREGTEDHRKLEIPAADIEALIGAVKILRKGKPPKRAGWKEWCDIHRRILGAYDLSAADEEERAVFEAIAEIFRRLESLDLLKEKITLPEFLEAFEREGKRAKLPRPASNGVAVLDAMSMRGLRFRHVFVVGMNAHVFPRFIVEEPFVGDAVRRHVLRVPGHHLPVRRDGYDEERLLFDILCRAASERVICFYQRADAEGRLKDPSPLLRPLPDRKEIPALPRGYRQQLAQSRVLTLQERLLVAEDPAPWLRALDRDGEGYARARAVVRSLDSEKVGPFEGIVGTFPVPPAFSPTRLETYAVCPFQYFAKEVLRLFPYEEGEETGDLTPPERGTLLHSVLEELFRNLAKTGFRKYDLDGEIERAAKWACAKFEERSGVPLTGALAARRDQLIRWARNYAAWDLSTLGEWTPVHFEKKGEATFAGVKFHGKIDRVDRHSSGAVRVIDYKTKGSKTWEGLESKAAKGKKLQAPLYLEFEGAGQALFRFIEDCTMEDPVRWAPQAVFDGVKWAKRRAEGEETVRNLVTSMGEGWFAIQPDEGEYGDCSWCDYGMVCRKKYAGLKEKAEGRTSGHGPQSAEREKGE